MTVELLGRNAGQDLAGMAASICTDSDSFKKALKGAMASGHESVIEHAVYTFLISGVSRVLLAQITRHRIASFSVQSQRYVKLCAGSNPCIIPKSIQESEFGERYQMIARLAEDLYIDMVNDGIPQEDARYIIPQGVTTDLIVTLNARELRHFFSLRCCNRAQWEIRNLADQMLAICKHADPVLFSDAGPGCIRGRCPEGSRSCGHPREDLR